MSEQPAETLDEQEPVELVEGSWSDVLEPPETWRADAHEQRLLTDPDTEIES